MPGFPPPAEVRNSSGTPKLAAQIRPRLRRVPLFAPSSFEPLSPMKILCRPHAVSFFFTLSIGLFAAAPVERAASTLAPLAPSLPALAADSNPADASASFDLPRIKAAGKGGGGDFVARGRATVHELSPNGRATARPGADPKVKYLAIDGGTGWATTIRGGAKDTTFVSFFLLAACRT